MLTKLLPTPLLVITGDAKNSRKLIHEIYFSQCQNYLLTRAGDPVRSRVLKTNRWNGSERGPRAPRPTKLSNAGIGMGSIFDNKWSQRGAQWIHSRGDITRGEFNKNFSHSPPTHFLDHNRGQIEIYDEQQKSFTHWGDDLTPRGVGTRPQILFK